MKKRLTYISPLQQGIVCAALSGLIGIIAVPFIIIVALFAHGSIMEAVLSIFLPILYAIGGFIAGIINALIYNLVAGWTGGIEFTLMDVPQ